MSNQATGHASQRIWCLSQARIKWEGCSRKGNWRKNRGWGVGCWLVRMEWHPVGLAPSWIVGVSASDSSSCTIKSTRRFLLALAHLGSLGKRAVKWLCVRVCQYKSSVNIPFSTHNVQIPSHSTTTIIAIFRFMELPSWWKQTQH